MRRSQFFITTIVIIALTLVLTSISLNIPKEINVNQLSTSNEQLDNVFFIDETLREVSDYINNNWLLPYTHRTIIRIKNNFNLKDYTVSANINLPVRTYIDSLALVDGNKKIIPFNIENKSIIYFQASSQSSEYKDYYLYYNLAPGSIKVEDKNQMVKFGEDSNSFWVRTGAYYALVNKNNGGKIDELRITDSPNVITGHSIESVIGCGSTEYTLYSASNKVVNITNMNYYLKAVFTGSRFTNETYKLTELFFPDKIILIDESNFASDSACNYFGFRVAINRNVLMNYFDSNKLTFEPTPDGGKMFTNVSWNEIYNNDYSLGFVPPHQIILGLNATTDENTCDFRLINNTTPGITKGLHVNNITIIPTNVRFNITKQYEKPSITIINEDLSSELSGFYGLVQKYFNDINAIVTHDYTVGLFNEPYTPLINWQGDYNNRRKLSAKGCGTLMPVEASVSLIKPDPNSVKLSNEIIIPTQVSTDNYHASSSFNGSLINTFVNNTLLIFNPEGDDFNITVIKGAGSLGFNSYRPNDSLINYFDVDSSIKEFLISEEQSGFYKLIFNGSASFRVNTSLPKIVGELPLIILNTSPLYFFVDEDVTKLDLSITTYSSDTMTFNLYDYLNNSVSLINRSSPGTTKINLTVIPCISGCNYRLETDDKGVFMINSSKAKYSGTNELFMINPQKPKISLISVNPLHSNKLMVYYNNNTNLAKELKPSDLIYDDYEVNNSFFSFDFNNLEFYYKGVDWFNGRGWVTCTNTCTDSFNKITLLEDGSERVVIWTNTSVGVDYYFHFYPNTSYFKVTVNSGSNYSFGPSWSVNNTDDTFYSSRGSSNKILGDTNKFLSKHNLTGPETYITKGDELSSFSIIFETNLINYNEAVKFNDTSVIINSFLPGDYYFLINQEPDNYLVPVSTNEYGLLINYSFIVEGLSIKGNLFS